VSAPAEFQATVRKTLRLVLIVTVPAAVTLFVLADDVIGVLFTLASFGPAVPILRIQAISLALVYVDYLLVCILMAVGRERTWIAIVAASCLLNPALNWVLIPAADAAYANGAVGAALAKLGTEVFFLVCTLRALPSGIFGAESARFAVGSAALGALLGLALFATRAVGVPWMLAAVVAGAGYLAVAVRLGLMPPDITSWVAGAFLRRRPARIEQAAGDIGSERSPSADAA
jgi:O-antigen/teichoic acid export membrane protein